MIDFMRLRRIFGEFGRQNNALFKQDSKTKLSIIRRCRRCRNMENTIVCLMILKARSFGRLKKKLWKSNEKVKLKPDMHV